MLASRPIELSAWNGLGTEALLRTSKQYPNSRTSSPPTGGPNRPCFRFPRTLPTRKYIITDSSRDTPRKCPTTKIKATCNVLLNPSAYAIPQASPPKKRKTERRLYLSATPGVVSEFMINALCECWIRSMIRILRLFVIIYAAKNFLRGYYQVCHLPYGLPPVSSWPRLNTDV